MSSKKIRLAVFASGSGTNAEEIFKHFEDHPAVEVVLLLSNNPNAFALQRAKNHHIKSGVFNRKEFREGDVILKFLRDAGATHIVLAGFLWLIPTYLLRAFPDRIINIHPALLPKYGGKGMYGAKVHEAVKAAAEPETGITIHLVNDQYDEGRILFQQKCSIPADLTPEEIAACVHKLEHAHYPKVIENWVLESVGT
ncbi:MAG TPA: phosphoribosylglycinamide formyltransferase [Chryseosolibacter sp.]|nr:phosphoribosylglycinamide formyltransferase [Chryseosolibacter sp.]